MLRIDCHFHPNFNFFSQKSIEIKAKEIWSKFKEKKIDFVICSEHYFKNPRGTFELLMKYKPKDHPTTLLPGIEATTKEGIDIILFSDSPNIFKNKDFLKKNNLNIDQFISKIKKYKNIKSIVAHPNVIFKQGLLSNLGEKKFNKYKKYFDFIEKHNACLNEVLEVFKHFKSFKFYQQLKNVKSLPKKYLKDKHYVAGSDAHMVEEIGSLLVLKTKEKPQNFKDLIRILKSKVKRKVIFHQSKNKYLHIFHKIKISILETVQSKIYNVINK